MDNDASRKQFEDAAFNQYFVSTIKRNSYPPRGFSGFDLISTADKHKDEFCRRGADGEYVEDGLSAAWWGWEKARERLLSRKALQARVLPWLLECFGAEIASDKQERNLRAKQAAKPKHSPLPGPSTALATVGPWCCERGQALGVQMCPECHDTCRAYSAAMGPDPSDNVLWRHVQTGGIYQQLCLAKRESDGELLAVYRNFRTGEIWVRTAAEFNDGRFIAIPSEPVVLHPGPVVMFDLDADVDSEGGDPA